MVTQGKPAQPRLVLTAAIGSVTLSAAIGVYTCCVPVTPPEPPPVPPVVVVDAADDTAAPPPDVKPTQCQFVPPKARGSRPKETRIVGGRPATLGAFPFAAAIATPTNFQYCGGSVVGSRFVLTAAHCQAEIGDRVLVGSTDLAQSRPIQIVESRIHPQFDSNTLDYDVAIAVLVADAGVAPVLLASEINTLDATVIGWGKTCETCATTQHLREVSIPLWDQSSCSEVYGTLTERQICAGLPAGGKDSCQGDSGGSLLTWNVDHFEQLGIVSWGAGCARPGTPGVYTDLRDEELAQWVEQCTRP